MSARFRIRKIPTAATLRNPWRLTDRDRPVFRGTYASHELALVAADNIIRRERGLAPRLPITTTEIAERMARERRARNLTERRTLATVVNHYAEGSNR